MPLDPILGAGREPQASGKITTYDTGTVNEDISVGSSETNTITLGTAERVVGIFVSIYRNTAGGVPTGNLINGQFNCFVNEQPIASYALPSTNEWASGISEWVPTNIELWGTGNSLKIVTSSAALGTSYNIFYRVLVYTIAM